MSRPEAFHQQYVALHNIPYLCGDGSGSGTPSSGGVLGRGQMVWTEEIRQPSTPAKPTAAFVEGIGIISLDPRWLARADALR